jgi:diketogulonate reductase-like aldo/keto reductase
MKNLPLHNDTAIPQLGLGVWQTKDGQQAIDAVTWALDAGYRHIDTAAIYRNEESVGQAVAEHRLPRDQVFITTKVWNDDIRAGNTRSALETSLRKLKTDYADLVLLHWPVDGFVPAWQELERAQEAGLVRAIGLSNFMPEDLDKLLPEVNVRPCINQIEYHPYLTQSDVTAACAEHSIQVEAWSPLMKGHFLEVDLFAEIGQKYGKTAAQVIIRWDLQRDIVTIPKSANHGRIRENFDVFDFELSSEDMTAIDALERGKRFGPDPRNFDF